eukprot:gene7337-5171_t
MEPPKNLKEHFTVVDDFFKKTFRQDSALFIGLKTVQYADSAPLEEVAAAAAEAQAPEGGNAVLSTTQGPLVVKLPHRNKHTSGSNFFALSPRLQFLPSGEAVGKVKITCGVVVPKICQVEQGVLLSSNGMVTARLKVNELLEGLELGGHLSVNTLASAAADASVVNFSYQRSDMFTAVKYQLNGLGSSNVAVDFGSKFLNLLVGAGFERQNLSYIEQESGAEKFDAMYVGGGFSGVNWSIGTKFTHTNGSWSNGRIAVLQKLKPSTTVACGYDLDIITSKAKVSLGFSQGVLLRLPHFLQPSNPTYSNGRPPFSRMASVPLIVAFKAESDGSVSATLRSIFNNAIRFGIVVHQNLRSKKKPQFGVVMTLEEESS